MGILSLFERCEGGHVYPWDFGMNYSNAGFASVFTIPFMLENGISASDYLKLKFPFMLHTVESGNSPVGLVAAYSQAVGGYMCGTGDYLTASISINVSGGVNQEPTAYYISFFDMLQNSVALPSNQYFYLQITITGTSVNIQSPGIKPPLEVTKNTTIITKKIYIYNKGV